MRSKIFPLILLSFTLVPMQLAQAQQLQNDDPANKHVNIDPNNPTGNQQQPQGPTGPINTESGGAPAKSPQGQTPPGMQAAPQGSQGSVKTEGSGATSPSTGQSKD